ncbi:radical SAM family heme chaperone HemW [Schleiferilactobacillus harbinensis]|uniref:Heme chaperone HemW n=1 Tax=Schleiferilactobacillus harbinensis TaxID=304207 RepID=A0ABU7T098_9LACO
MAAAYIHIPFCEHICYYCNFNKVFIQGQPVDDYITRLLEEIKMVLAEYPDESIETVYIGGGTPSALSPEQMDRLLSGVNDLLPLPAGGEFTIECNPNNLLTMDLLHVFKDHGVNRLSVGVQSFDDAVLKKIGRTHRAKDVYTAFKNARAAGFDNMSMDLIYRLPGQTYDDFADSLRQAVSLDLPHYATYSLILEQRTVFYNLMRAGKLHLPSDDTEADEYELAMDYFADYGLHQYEISNFAKPGYESVHNKKYWQNEDYFGFGAGAWGYLDRDRYHNFGPIQQYLNPLRAGKVPVFARQLVSPEEQMEEQMFLGLRLNAGVDRQRFAQRFKMTIEDVYGQTVPELVAQGLVTDDGRHVALTKRGRFIGNDVFEKFLLDDAD